MIDCVAWRLYRRKGIELFFLHAVVGSRSDGRITNCLGVSQIASALWLFTVKTSQHFFPFLAPGCAKDYGHRGR